MNCVEQSGCTTSATVCPASAPNYPAARATRLAHQAGRPRLENHGASNPLRLLCLMVSKTSSHRKLHFALCLQTHGCKSTRCREPALATTPLIADASWQMACSVTRRLGVHSNMDSLPLPKLPRSVAPRIAELKLKSPFHSSVLSRWFRRVFLSSGRSAGRNRLTAVQSAHSNHYSPHIPSEASSAPSLSRHTHTRHSAPARLRSRHFVTQDPCPTSPRSLR